MATQGGIDNRYNGGYLPYQQHLRDTFARNVGTPTGGIVSGAARGNLFGHGGVLLDDSRVYVISQAVGTSVIYNIANNTTTIVAGDGCSACLLANGFIVTDRGQVLDNNATQILPALFAISQYRGVTVLQDGYTVVFSPFNNANLVVYRYNPTLNTFTLVNTLAHGNGALAYQGCVTLPNGNVALCSFASTAFRVYNPTTNTFVITTPLPAGNKYVGIVLLPQNGNVLLVPNGAANAVEYNPYTGALVNTYNTGTGFSGACIHHTGEVVLCSFGNTNHKVLNINTNTVTNYAKLAGSFVGCVELPNRKVLMIPFNAANFQIITHEVPTNPTAINTEVLKSIYLNKGL